MSNLKDKQDEKERCFVIMPISDQEGYPIGHFQKVYDQILIPAIEDAGFTPYRVDENKICDSIINKIFDAIQNCSMAICDLSSKNPNVLYELGLRQAYDKPVVLIQDDLTDKIFDIGGINTVFYKSSRLYEDVIDARKQITDAIIATKENGGIGGSLVKAIKVGTASISDEVLSQDDRIQIMLQSILNDLQVIKKKSSNNIKEQLQSNKLNVYDREMIIDICHEIMSKKDVLSNEELLELNKRLRNYTYKNKNDLDKEIYNLIDETNAILNRKLISGI